MSAKKSQSCKIIPWMPTDVSMDADSCKKKTNPDSSRGSDSDFLPGTHPDGEATEWYRAPSLKEVWIQIQNYKGKSGIYNSDRKTQNGYSGSIQGQIWRVVGVCALHAWFSE